MYECYEGNIREGREAFPVGWILGENALFLANWTLAGWLLWPVQAAGWPVATLGWAAFVVVVQILLKKHFCTGCYYWGKSCHLCWGHLSAALFEQDSGNPKLGLALAVPMYMLSPPLILIGAIVIGALLGVQTLHWILLGAFVGLNALSFPLRTKGCKQCKMRDVCPGSAVKPNKAA